MLPRPASVKAAPGTFLSRGPLGLLRVMSGTYGYTTPGSRAGVRESRLLTVRVGLAKELTVVRTPASTIHRQRHDAAREPSRFASFGWAASAYRRAARTWVAPYLDASLPQRAVCFSRSIDHPPLFSVKVVVVHVSLRHRCRRSAYATWPHRAGLSAASRLSLSLCGCPVRGA